MATQQPTIARQSIAWTIAAGRPTTRPVASSRARVGTSSCRGGIGHRIRLSGTRVQIAKPAK
jgi:hypothetical protein